MEVEPSLAPTAQSSPPVTPERHHEKQRYAVMTWLYCVVCVVVFLGLQNERNRYSWEALERWGCYPPSKIRAGALWAFITSAFNVCWLFVLGAKLERVIGWLRWLAFVLAAAFLSSGAEFAFSDSTGIGASGVVYAIFGFMWVLRRKHPSFQKVLDSRTAGWFVLWLIGCVFMTQTKVWEVGNAAHIVGVLFGAGIGAWCLWPERRNLLKVGFAGLFLLSVIPVLWAPWSRDWTSEAGTRAYEHGNYATAIEWYNRSLGLGQDKAWCLQSIALAYSAAGDKAQYQLTLESLRKLDEKSAKDLEEEVNKTPTSGQKKQ